MGLPCAATQVGASAPAPAALRQRPGLLVGHAQLLESRDGPVVHGECFGQQTQLQVGVGQLLLGNGQLLRHGELFILKPRRLEPGECIAKLATRQLQQGHRLVDQRQQHREPVVGGAHAGPRVNAQRFVEVAERGDGVCHADVGHHRVLHLAAAREQHRRLAVVAGSGGIVVAVQQQPGEVDDHAARGLHHPGQARKQVGVVVARAGRLL